MKIAMTVLIGLWFAASQTLCVEREVLQNGGFESGILGPWISSNWIMETNTPQKGLYCVSDVGNNSIRQDFPPVPGEAITSVTFWARQPENASLAYDFFYSDGSHKEFVVYPTTSWVQYNATSNLSRANALTGFQIWGYAGGGEAPDSTFVDEVSIKRVSNAGLQPLSPMGDSIYSGDKITPCVSVDNAVIVAESLIIWCVVEDTGKTDTYEEPLTALLFPGTSQLISFPVWTPRRQGRYRAMFSFDRSDTTWYYFTVKGPSIIVAGPVSRLPESAFLCLPSIGRSFEFRYAPVRSGAITICNAAGLIVWSERLGGALQNSIRWNGVDRRGQHLTSGVYFVCVETGHWRATRKLIIR